MFCKLDMDYQLFQAVRDGNLSMARYLLDEGADANAGYWSGFGVSVCECVYLNSMLTYPAHRFHYKIK